MAIKKEAPVTIKVSLDENKIPEKINLPKLNFFKNAIKFPVSII